MEFKFCFRHFYIYIYDWSTEIIDPLSTVDAINGQLKEHTESNGIEYLNYFSEMVDDRKSLKKEYTSEWAHLNKKGYELMLIIAEKKLKFFYVFE